MTQENKNQYNIKSYLNENINITINNVLKNINERNPVKIRDFTPLILVENGVENLPIYENPLILEKTY